ncbi:uncharacterized protein ATC70_003860 [Mucor velutinosus]|uniref:Uncharacterized protein n=1 Tax=Mucor velutinosus TaxID=708070 RepID=A0AAN7D6I5_9FUNG|nr:hypothetical protein ATC70_003860 [Mucor velutinosus]
MDELAAFVNSGNASLTRIKRLVLFLLISQRQHAQEIEDLNTQQQRLSAELRGIRELLGMSLTHVEEAVSTQSQPQQQELAPVKQQQYDMQPKQAKQSFKSKDALQPSTKKPPVAYDNDQWSTEVTTSGPAPKKEELARKQKQSLDREERAKKLSKRHQQAKKEAQKQPDESLSVLKQGNKRRDEREPRMRSHSLNHAAKHTAKRQRH